MTRLTLVTTATEARLEPLRLSFEDGLSVLVCEDADARARLAEMLVGLRHPRRGRVQLDDVELGSSAEQRARVASVLRDEILPDAPNVARAIELAFELRGVRATPEACLASFELQGLLALSPLALDAHELRAIAFAVAMTSSELAKALVVYDPFALSPLVTSSVVMENCRRLARERVVVALVPELEQAVRFGGRCMLLDGARVTSFGALLAGPPTVVFARSARAAELAALLGTDATIQHVEAIGAELRVTCADPIAFSRHLAQVALTHDIELHGLASPNPSLAERLHLRAHREGR